MKKLTIFLILLAILISCSGCGIISLNTDKITDGKDAPPDESRYEIAVNNSGSDSEDGSFTYHVIRPDGSQNSYVVAPGDNDPVQTDDPIEASTQATTPVPDGYQYDIGTRIENPDAEDFQLLYDMIALIGQYWPNFDENSVNSSNVIDYILDSDGHGAFYAYDFNFYTEHLNFDDYFNSQRRYYIADIEWVAMAVFGEVLDHDSLNGDRYDNRYTEDLYYYRHNEEDYMGNPAIFFTEFEPSYEKLSNGNWKFTIHATGQDELGLDEPVLLVFALEAIPMYSTDLGTYWRLISFEHH